MTSRAVSMSVSLNYTYRFESATHTPRRSLISDQDPKEFGSRMWYYRSLTTTTTTPAPPTSVWDFNGKDISPNVISCVIFCIGLFLLIYALHCCKTSCQKYVNMERSSRNMSNVSHRSETVMEHAPSTLPVFTVLIHTPIHHVMDTPPPSYEWATDIIDQPPKYEDCIR